MVEEGQFFRNIISNKIETFIFAGLLIDSRCPENLGTRPWQVDLFNKVMIGGNLVLWFSGYVINSINLFVLNIFSYVFYQEMGDANIKCAL